MSTGNADPSSPLWAKVLADLRRRLANGEFARKFPGDTELVETYGVSRHTVREAVRRLQAEGLLERRRGRGSFISAPAIEQPVGTLYSFYRSIEEAGIAQESVVRHLEERRDDRAEAMLACIGQPLVYLERLRLADGEPIALDWSWLPARLARGLLNADFRHAALYEQLAECCGVRLTSGWERIRPVLPDRRQRALLEMDAGQAAFELERFGVQGDVPVEWRHSVVRGDRFSFVARWSSEHVDASFEPGSGGGERTS
ncbi:MAG TPA: GntR family transcriptional regulator [Acidimicrobiales bacterium]|nr:GntR family transcriptional regulator [Acidimicrobiales bacterium]